jgi:hypothetical protein
MKRESRLITGTPMVIGPRTIIPVAQFSALISERSCLASVNPLALIIEEDGIFFFAPVQEGVTWEQVSPAFGIETSEMPQK